MRQLGRTVARPHRLLVAARRPGACARHRRSTRNARVGWLPIRGKRDGVREGLARALAVAEPAQQQTELGKDRARGGRVQGSRRRGARPLRPAQSLDVVALGPHDLGERQLGERLLLVRARRRGDAHGLLRRLQGLLERVGVEGRRAPASRRALARTLPATSRARLAAPREARRPPRRRPRPRAAPGRGRRVVARLERFLGCVDERVAILDASALAQGAVGGLRHGPDSLSSRACRSLLSASTAARRRRRACPRSTACRWRRRESACWSWGQLARCSKPRRASGACSAGSCAWRARASGGRVRDGAVACAPLDPPLPPRWTLLQYVTLERPPGGTLATPTAQRLADYALDRLQLGSQRDLAARRGGPVAAPSAPYWRRRLATGAPTLLARRSARGPAGGDVALARARHGARARRTKERGVRGSHAARVATRAVRRRGPGAGRVAGRGAGRPGGGRGGRPHASAAGGGQRHGVRGRRRAPGGTCDRDRRRHRPLHVRVELGSMAARDLLRIAADVGAIIVELRPVGRAFA